MKNKVIGVVMGGPSAEREVSLNTGKAIIKALTQKGYNVAAIDLNPSRIVEQLRAAKIDVVFNAIHGKYGEDGLLQGVLEMLNIPYTGSGVLASAMAMDKGISKRLFLSAKIPTPRSVLYGKAAKERKLGEEILADFKLPLVVKSAAQGSSIGVYIVEVKEKLSEAITEAFKYSEQVLVEDYILGKEVTVSIIGRSEKPEALPIIEIAPDSGRYDYYSKYTKGATEYLIPARVDSNTAENITQVSLQAFQVLGCHGIGRVDVMLDENHNPYVLEVNTIPGMTETSLVPKAAAAAGISFINLCELLLKMVNK